MVTKKYLTDKIVEFELKHQYRGYLTNSFDREISRRWKDEQRRKDEKWQAIRNNDDVELLIGRFDGIVTSFENARNGFYEDGFEMALALYNALRGLRKLAEFVEHDNMQFTPISTEEADAIFTRLDEIASRMEEVNLRRAMSD